MVAQGEVTVIVKAEHLVALCKALHEEEPFRFVTLIDVCGIDYLHYGLSDWQTESRRAPAFLVVLCPLLSVIQNSKTLSI